MTASLDQVSFRFGCASVRFNEIMAMPKDEP